MRFNKIEKLILPRFAAEKKVSTDITSWDDNILKSWLRILPDNDIISVIELGTENDKSELLKLYKNEVIKNGKRLSICLIENEGVFDEVPESPPERKFHFNVI